jgi:hypothetical protein
MKECYKVRNLFGAYLYDDVTPTECAIVEEHIADCEECANDLRSRQKVLERLKPNPQPAEIPQMTQNDFAWGVYRRIASDTMKRRSRQIFMRRFVLQPAFAVVALAAILTVGVVQFRPDGKPIQELASVETDETSQKELRDELYLREFLERQGMVSGSEPGYVSASKTAIAEPLSPDTEYPMRDVLLNDSRRRLEEANFEANFYNYSLGDPERALAEYQRLVDDYSSTDAAVEARERIRAIRGIESSVRVESIDIRDITNMGI